MRCLKQQFAGAEVHYLTKPAFASLLRNNPYVDEVHVLDQPVLNKALELKKRGFDYVIDLHHNLRSRLVKTVLDVPAFCFDKLNTEKAQLVSLKQNTLPPLHIVDRYLQTLQSFGVTNDGKGLDYCMEAGTESFFTGNPLPGQFIAFAIGAQHATKRLPDHQIITICKGIALPVILLGGKEDAERGQEIIRQCGSNVSSFCGVLSLDQSAYVVSKAQKVITHDTGLMHIAAALQKEIISVWGNTVPEFGMTPYYGAYKQAQTVFEVKGLSCRPCSKIGFKACPLGHFNCMNLQPAGEVAAKVNGA